MIFGFGRTRPRFADVGAALAALVRCDVRVSAEGLARCRAKLPNPATAEDWELLLCHAGGDNEPEYEDDLRPNSPDIAHLDGECIYDRGDEARLLRRVAVLAGGELPPAEARDFVDLEQGEAWLEWDGDSGRAERRALRIIEPSDFLDSAIFAWVDERLARQGSSRGLADRVLGQDFLMVCLAPEQEAALTELTGLRFRRAGPRRWADFF